MPKGRLRDIARLGGPQRLSIYARWFHCAARPLDERFITLLVTSSPLRGMAEQIRRSKGSF